MSRIKMGIIILLVILVALQFFQPAQNRNVQVQKSGLSSVTNIPPNVQAILKNSCYDCHSNNTRYPWYASIQPGAWWMASHIKEGKDELNFDEFGKYSKRRQKSKLKSIASAVSDGTMPIASYLFIHKDAALSKAEQTLIKEWAEQAQKQDL